jgi:hypothetical protein
MFGFESNTQQEGPERMYGACLLQGNRSTEYSEDCFPLNREFSKHYKFNHKLHAQGLYISTKFTQIQISTRALYICKLYETCNA